MIYQISFQSFYYAPHLVAFVHLVFRLLGLILEFTRQTCILDDCKFSGAYQLVFVHVKHFDFNSSDLQKHVLPQLVDLHDFVMLNFFKFSFVGFPLQVTLSFPVVALSDKRMPVFFKFVVVVNFCFEFPDHLI